MNKFLSIQDAAKCLGVSPQTLRRWEKQKKITPCYRTQGGQRRYDITQLQPFNCRDKTSDRLTVAYARVSSHDQKEDLQRQVHMLEIYCSAKGWMFSVTKDLGSGMNYNKRGLKQLLEQIMNGQIGRLVLTHKDRLLRFGAELVFSLCAVKNVEVVRCPPKTGQWNKKLNRV
jgi:excisionase family DNA binding protein